MANARAAAARTKAIAAIERRGALLVYPIKNKPEPLSIWSELYPRRKMVWDWDVGADDRVAQTWALREELSRSNEVVYAKWFQDRATFFSFETCAHLLAFLGSAEKIERGLKPQSAEALEILLGDSPLSTKQLKAALSTEGRMLEPEYTRLMKPLWRSLLVVGFGEFEDSSFPSLGIGATATLFEDVWREGARIGKKTGEAFLRRKWGEDSAFFRFAQKIVSVPQ